mmetsp:Transcript_39107/g.83361  ORF Transcript_39107/g.83361 Transcript_39107/m.83361 type:complete len:262 (-) Transcript_39107:421-1206(-)|eukprot:CAMPEP_0183360262 /NCGR_PEP_ID=MMETSP0164_2-20130417/54750_1 /TAXON_ID=221442 /ORGANISM="Coccolithus pelagicus ssp braarudi, Strain PLY182g" /LENGTH=261 /DNA_ID=CAMNT_0025534585 /DNA_START=281 /DNA_END=1066 /DNA_ORIENTATION=+
MNMPSNPDTAIKLGPVSSEAKALREAITAEEQSTGVFAKIYNTGMWSPFDGPGGGSGYGSAPTAAAGASRIIFHVVMMLNAHRVIDAPCGSMVWQGDLVTHLRKQIPDFAFLGIDIVPQVIARNRRVYAHQPFFQFAVADISDEKYVFPTGYDLIYCRDALMHLPNRLVHRALRNMACSDASNVLIGSANDRNTSKRANVNQDIHTGSWRPLALMLPPFNLRPQHIYIEGAKDRRSSSLYLFEVRHLRKQLQIECSPTHSL